MNNNDTYLSKILKDKKDLLLQTKNENTFRELKQKVEDLPKTRDFINSLKSDIKEKDFAVIAEMKKASPSQGIIREHYDPGKIADKYLEAGATCLSILTDLTFFKGENAHLTYVKNRTTLPVLRKDFVVDEFQIYETRAIGADCILLIKSALSKEQLIDFYYLSKELDLDVLIEIHSSEELLEVIDLNPELLGVNNRNLTTFEVDINNTKEISRSVPESTLLVCESGIKTKEDIQFIKESGVKAFLIGETFMRATDPGKELQNLFN